MARTTPQPAPLDPKGTPPEDSGHHKYHETLADHLQHMVETTEVVAEHHREVQDQTGFAFIIRDSLEGLVEITNKVQAKHFEHRIHYLSGQLKG